MKRRSFIGALAALPCMSWLAPKQSVDVAADALLERCGEHDAGTCACGVGTWRMTIYREDGKVSHFESDPPYADWKQVM